MKHGTLALLNRETNEISIETSVHLTKNQEKKTTYKPGEGVTGAVIQSGNPIVVEDIKKSPEFLDKTGQSRARGSNRVSFICVPVLHGNETIGAFSMDKVYQNIENIDEDLKLLAIISSMIAKHVKLKQKIVEKNQRLLDENSRLHQELKASYKPDNIIGSSQVMQDVFLLIDQVSKSDATVLIRGESGTGKELVAHAIHYNSLRSDKPFIKINCAALPESLIESELFGHEKGAFTGAMVNRKGRFELANGGTIFLDEIGELSPAIQVKLLRVLQEREIERVGGSKVIKVDVRIITATNRSLEDEIIKRNFREDLYYRLNVFPIIIPPIRERKTDIIPLCDHFIEKYNKKNGKNIKRISSGAIDLFTSYHWPGNVRELENCIERAVIISPDNVIHGHNLPPSLQSADSTGTQIKSTLNEAVEALEREMLIETLKTTKGNRAAAARVLGITERQIGTRVFKYNLQNSYFIGSHKNV
ncbi:MAG: sigma-54-dependent Fis family transcriptional regulator [Spirochaetaceae bacterium 4572_7]|nr:MAG: sigma-54-dependent Fis family transcriptional regulator [Spirochaetaceae bacterium 4572_7]